MLSGGLLWDDEYPPINQLHAEELLILRMLLRYRASLIANDPETKLADYWLALNEAVPAWPGFNPSRSDVKLHAKLVAGQQAAMAEIDKLFDS